MKDVTMYILEELVRGMVHIERNILAVTKDVPIV